ncbi:hypothetical protein L1887_16843 [Cichorium endivia]|nr:hypothetical protein L1887_16843 [Cichorium endivia]
MKRVYGSPKNLMVSEEDEDSTVKCRERRRRRMAMRRMAGIAAGAPCSSVVVGEDERQKLAARTPSDKPTSSTPAAAIMSLISIMETPPPPVYGMMSVVGRQREMEDEVSVHTNLCRPEINGFRPVHFFGVFDGHGGRHVSALCKENMHVIMEEELMGIKLTGDESDGGDGGGELWKKAIKRSFQRMDDMSMRLCLCDGARVEGILAMSRAIGDRLLKQWVTSEPEISVTRREAGDECLIVASDGLWDVLSSELACKIVHECLGENQEPRIEANEGAAAGSSSDAAATLLIRLALGRRSTDNISVIIIDLRN